MEKIWIDATDFTNLGGWQLETQFVREMGQPYLIACDIPGTPVEDATIEFSVGQEGWFRFFVRTKNWKYPEAPGQFTLAADGKELPNLCGKMPALDWYIEIAGDCYLKPGKHTLSVCDKTGWLSRLAAVIITNDLDFTPSQEKHVFLRQRAQIKKSSTDIIDRGNFDFVVVGAGPGGTPTAIAAARNGLKTALISGRPTIGGNASDEGTIGLDGAGSRNLGWKETGIADEISRIRVHKKVSWQKAMEMLCENEPNLTVFVNELCSGAETKDGKITAAICVNTITLEKHCYRGTYFADCSGDGWLGYYAGADLRIGREAKHEFNEPFAPESPDTLTMSGCLCQRRRVHDGTRIIRTFHAYDTGKPIRFETPDWAVHLPEGDALQRTPTNYNTADWWMENSNDFDDLYGAEFARDELVRLGVGYFSWMKNSYANHSKMENYALDAIALHNSKRENRRLIGDYILTQNDYVEGKTFPDTVAYCGWSIDVHHVKGIFSGKEGPFHSNQNIPVSPIPFRCLYSKNIDNLFMASRCASFSHIALGATRVEGTLAVCGEAVGTAAALCKKYGIMPRRVYTDYIDELQQLLLAGGLTILGVTNHDINDFARTALVTASSAAAFAAVSSMHGVSDGWHKMNEKCYLFLRHDFYAVAPEYYSLELKNDSECTINAVIKLYTFNSKDAFREERKEIAATTVALIPHFEGWVNADLPLLPAGAGWAISVDACDGLYWRERVPADGMLTACFVQPDGTEMQDTLRALQIGYSSKIDVPCDCSPENVVNGNNRSDYQQKQFNAWRSDEKDGLPQSITLTLEKTAEIHEVRIVTDTDLCYPMYSFQYVPLADKTVSDLTVEVLQNGTWKKAGGISGNFRRLVTINFEPTTAEAVRVNVTKTLGAKFATIYEIRIY